MLLLVNGKSQTGKTYLVTKTIIPNMVNKGTVLFIFTDFIDEYKDFMPSHVKYFISKKYFIQVLQAICNNMMIEHHIIVFLDDASAEKALQRDNPEIIDILTKCRHNFLDLIVNIHNPKFIWSKTRCQFTDVILFGQFIETVIRQIYDDFTCLHCEKFKQDDFVKLYNEHTGNGIDFNSPEKVDYFHNYIYIKTPTTKSKMANILKQDVDLTNAFHDQKEVQYHKPQKLNDIQKQLDKIYK